MRPHVCLVLETYWPQVGGGETAGRWLARGLVGRGYRVTVLTRRSARDVPARETDGGVEIRRLPPAGPGGAKRWPLAAAVLARLLATRPSPDVLVGLGFRVLGAPLVIAGKVSGRPVVLKAESRGELSGAWFRPGLERRGLDPNAPWVRLLLERRNRLLRSARFVAMTSELEREFRTNGVPEDRIRRIPNAVDTDRFEPPDDAQRTTARLELGVAEEERLIVFTGRLVTYKGLPELVEAWPGVVEAVPEARLAVVGEDGGDVHACGAELRRRAAALGVDTTIRFPGVVRDVRPWLWAADAFAFPSREEAFGLSLLEAMSCGLPCVTTTTGGLGDIVTPGEDALVVPPGDAVALRDALVRCVSGDAAIRELGRRARRTACRRYSSEAVLEEWDELLRGVSSGEISRRVPR